MDRLVTQSLILEGGVMSNLPTIDQGMRFPGSLQFGQNLEPDYDGGYSRVQGYTKYDAATVDGSGSPVLGTWVYGNTISAVAGTNLYTSTGSGWTNKSSASSFSSSTGLYIGETFTFSTAVETLIIVNGTDYPATWNGSSFVRLSIAQASTYVTAHKHHMFYSKGQIVSISAAGNHLTLSGGAAINVGHEVTAMVSYRDAVYCLGPKGISKITGSSASDWALEAISKTVGIVSPRTLQEVNGDIVFLSYDGIRSIASTDKLDDINLENLSRNIEKNIKDSIQPVTGKSVSSLILNSKNQYRLFISDSSYSRGTQPGFLGALRKQSQGGVAWEWFTTKGFEVNCAGQGIISTVETAVHGDFDGYVYQEELGDSFDGDNIAVTLKTPYWSFNDPEMRKTLHKLRSYVTATDNVSPNYQMTLDYLDASRPQPAALNGATATGTFSKYGTATYGSSVYSGGVTFATDFHLIGTCFNAALTISSSDTNVPYTVQSLNIQYGVGGRK
tara:strand:+ start:8423 stop:9925 length:1503 start_codon:yes stop_codon:yes gene_type:complete